MKPILAALATAAALVLAVPAGAATVNETDLQGGSFSSVFDKPTVLGAGVTGATGTGNSGQHDFFVFTGLPAGAQTLTFSLWAPQGIGFSYSAGGTIKTSTEAFRWGWDGVTAGTFQSGFWDPTDGGTLTLGQAFAGTLHVGLYFTHGANLSWSVSTNAAPAPTAPAAPSVVPLPGAGLLLLTALGGAAVAARRRRG
jgi:hypothetical protein